MARKKAGNPHAAALADDLQLDAVVERDVKGSLARELRGRPIRTADVVAEIQRADRTLPGPRTGPQLRQDWLQAAEKKRVAKLQFDDAVDAVAGCEKNLENALDHAGFSNRIEDLARALVEARRVESAAKTAKDKAAQKERDAWEFYEPHALTWSA